jgi:hypothetical protein
MSRYTRLASTNEQEESISRVEKWLAKLNKRIVGATTIGKSPQAVILDLTYQGGEIYVSRDGEIRVNDELVEDNVDFEEALEVEF